MRIQLVRFVDQPHHQLRFSGMDQLRLQAGLLNLLHNPVPIPRRFDRHSGPFLSTLQTLSNGAGGVLNPSLPGFTGSYLFPFHPAVALMHVECYKFFHSAAPFFFVGTHHYRMADGVALSYFHSGESRNPGFPLTYEFTGPRFSPG
jgi:hypothetical protein